MIVLFIATDCKKNDPASMSVISTSIITDITTTTATSGGYISSDGGASVISRGVCWSATVNPTTSDSKTTDGDSIGQYVSNIIGLTAGTNYHVRSYATNSVGTSYGADILFMTLGESASSITLPATEISLNSATLNGIINPNSLSTTITFEYGITINYGTEVTAIQSPLTGGDIVNVSAHLTGLAIGTTYHFRVKSVNSSGTNYGGDMVFTTLLVADIMDIDGNIYNAIMIGNQVWMVENLKTTRYNDGESITNVTDNSAWVASSADAYCWYNNDETTYKNMYGALYNWNSVNTGKLCPTGWHVPSDTEWTALQTFLGGNLIAGGELKESGIIHWSSPNTGADNSSGFTALPGGYRTHFDGTFLKVNTDGYWWSATLQVSGNAWYYFLYNISSVMYRGNDGYKNNGFSVRCIKD